MSGRYVTQKDANAIMRKRLAARFPGVRFRVVGSGHTATNVTWTDGPAEVDVEAIARQFEGASFDGMQDLESPIDQVLDGEVVHYGLTYVFCRRTLSPELEAEARAALEADGVDVSDPWRTLGDDIPAVATRLGYRGYDGHNVATWVRIVGHLIADQRAATVAA